MVCYEERELAAMSLILEGEKKWFFENRLLLKQAWEIIEALSGEQGAVRLTTLMQYKENCKKVTGGRGRIKAILQASGVKIERCPETGVLMAEIKRREK